MNDIAAPSVRLATEAFEAIRQEAKRVYPHEGCGALLGPAPGEVSETLALPNQEQDKPRVRFTVSPQDYLATEASADARGLTLLGFWHSHPDHPARPSETDRQFGWPYYSYVIVSIANRKAVDMTSWVLDEQTEMFARQEIDQG